MSQNSLQWLNEQIRAAEEALEDKPDGHPSRLHVSDSLAIHLFGRYNLKGDVKDLDDAIRFTRQSAESASADDPRAVGNLGAMLARRYERGGKIEDLDEAILLTQKSIESNPSDDFRPFKLSNLASMMSRRYEKLGNVQDLKDSVEKSRQVALVTPKEHRNRAGVLQNLGSGLLRLYNRIGDDNDLDEALEVMRQAADLTPRESPYRTGVMNNLAAIYGNRYSRFGLVKDLENAIHATREAAELTLETDPDKGGRLDTLGTLLSTRYDRFGDFKDLEEAVQTVRQAATLGSSVNHYHEQILSHLGILLGQLYRSTGEMKHLEESIASSRQALAAALDNDDNQRAIKLTNLGCEIADHYNRTGNMRELEEAIQVSQLAVELIAKDHPDRAAILVNMGNKLHMRYVRIGETQDILQAIQLVRQARDLTQVDHNDRAEILANLGQNLGDLYNRVDDIKILEEAIKSLQEALDLTQSDHSSRVWIQDRLAGQLQRYYKYSRNMDDLDKAIQLTRKGMILAANNYFELIGFLNNLGNRLATRYDRTGDKKELEEAVELAKKAVNLTPEDDPNRAVCLNMLGEKLEKLNPQDRSAALDCYILASRCSQARPLTRIYVSRKAIDILCKKEDWKQATQIAKDALDLIPLVCGRFFNRDDQQYAIVQSSGLVADACSLSIKAGYIEQALEQLEFGRGIVIGYMIDTKDDLSALKKDCPTLAKRYEDLRFNASRQVDEIREPAIRNQILKDRREAASKIEDCLREIRRIKRYEKFLQGPTADDLKSFAKDDAVVLVNVTDIGQDAIILFQENIHFISLPDLVKNIPAGPLQKGLESYASLRSQQRDIGGESEIQLGPDHLSWLWINCVKLVLDKIESLGFFDAHETPRVWWIGSGIANSFPFHAAGVDQHSSSGNALSRVVSSYTPTIKTLAYSISRAAKLPRTSIEKPRVVVVTMATTPGQLPLDGVDREWNAIKIACGKSYSLEHLPQPTAKTVLEKIPTANISHFACHGVADYLNPSNSHLLLQKQIENDPVVDRLNLSSISTAVIKETSWIAFLSACSTAKINVNELADEGLHLASAFQVAGYPHVVGSLWSADDDACSQLADYFYGSLAKKKPADLSDKLIARALRDAVLKVRSKYPNSPYIWAPFVHFGA